MDIDGDGIVDIVAGSYEGEIVYYKGTKNGFEPRRVIPQKTDINDRGIFMSYLFTNPSFGDLNGDGLLDAFIGGAEGMRYMLNVGTKEAPAFGERLPLLGVDGKQISIIDLTEKDMSALKKNGMTTPDFKTYVYFLDWDNDGVGDIVATTSNITDNVNAIDFYKGVQTKEGIRFENRVPLFTATDGGKAFDAKILIPYFYDMNGDGALDILMGMSSNKIENTERAKGYVMVFLSKKCYKAK